MSFLWLFALSPLLITTVVAICALFAAFTSNAGKARRAIEIVKLLRGSLPRIRR
ncbi:hypothetical protein OOK48_14950 [Streptomyces viridodiastaticus]|uniref:hypothetical protein n=1 Tax=Streptomyces albogriseolus TaxID=1887 RepID=UPI002259AA91|nr:hypothetical protein [Streptomyces viridodiastaticus]MCX4567640.1 hypothetical protein [Streptomyces viridodiastaticus]